MATGAAVMDGVKLLYNNDGENLWAVDSSGARAGAYHPHTGYAIDTATIRARFPDAAERLGADGMLSTDAIGQAYVDLHRQPRSAWSFEIDLRPWSERF